MSTKFNFKEAREKALAYDEEFFEKPHQVAIHLRAPGLHTMFFETLKDSYSVFNNCSGAFGRRVYKTIDFKGKDMADLIELAKQELNSDKYVVAVSIKSEKFAVVYHNHKLIY